ncbi:gamma carbonic anhydrase family protein [Nonomuraea sp. NPDC048916]|uniref:gamma carbonic anhydrase family protein n=1 Tax=Nonomuraea sp. NPDC048916 TaxID=3154232 RepID=UPI00340A7BE8
MPAPQTPPLISFAGVRPTLAEDAWVAPGAIVAGAVTLASRSSVWFTAVIRADGDTVHVGEDSNLQDGVVVHADPGFPVTLGRGVSVGHRAVLHGCAVDDDVLIGMGAVVLNGARIGRGTLVAAGAVVLEGTVIPPGSLVAGVPGKVRRALTETEVDRIRDNAGSYVLRASQYAREVAS